jgi:hypothetical protein
MLRLGLAIASLFLTANYAVAGELNCQGPFAKDTDHKRLVTAFGRANVAQETVYEPEGLEVRASIVFPKDPTRRLVVLWADGEALRHPARIDLVGSGWSGPKGLRIGTPIDAVEKANGKPFTLYGFEWDYGGRVESWNGGELGSLPGGCLFAPIFETDANAPAEALDAVAGDSQFASNSKAMRAAKPRIRSLALSYPQE